MPDISTRWGISEPKADRSDVADVPLFVRNVVSALEAKGLQYDQGTFALRPVSSGGTPGIEGRLYISTDQSPFLISYDFGTGWFDFGSVTAGSVGTAELADGCVITVKLADGAVTALKIANNTITAAQIADNTLTAAKLVNAIVPSRGASGGTEALRALGTASGNAAPGIHGSNHLPGGADPIPFVVPGTRTGRPAAGAINAGQFYYAADQDALYLSDGSNWLRIGSKAGDIIYTLETAARTGYVIAAGQAWPSTGGIYADLFAVWGGTNLPDLRGRTFVALGTHTEVNAVLNSDGLAVGSRTPRHSSSVNVPSGGQLGKNFNGASAGGGTQPTAPGGNVTVGPQDASRPVDMPAYIVLVPQVKL